MKLTSWGGGVGGRGGGADLRGGEYADTHVGQDGDIPSPLLRQPFIFSVKYV
jgi:hypothetical protein